MIHAIVGHRGVGKTSFLQRIKYYYESRSLPCTIFDLDQEIERREGKSISEIFSTRGEPYFRELEKNIFSQLLSEVSVLSGSVFIALGAGFSGGMPDRVSVWWLRRSTDRLGRIFMDRPRLESEITPLEEFMRRYDERESHYRKIAHKEIFLSEGWDFVNPYEPAVLGLKPLSTNAAVTLLPWHMAHPLRLEDFIQDHLQLGVRFFELRDDLLSEEQIRQVVQEIPAEKILISFRRADPSESLMKLSGPYATDWALELGPSPFSHNFIVSLHTRVEDETVDEASKRLLAEKADHYKLAIPIGDFVELWAGHRFYTEDPERRSFLPVSAEGRWQWYRLLQNKRMKVNFIRYGEGSAPDQPTLFDFVRYPEDAREFAAVLGDPVVHSRTPAEQGEFFLQHNMGVLPVLMREEECHSLNLGILQRMGMRAAAVTSPLKKKMTEVCASIDRQASELKAVNTIVSTSSGWVGSNTDVDGLRMTIGALELPSKVVVWGGGGTRSALLSLLPHAKFFSARRGEPIWIEGPEAEKEFFLREALENPEVVVWAVGRSRMETSQWPSPDWRPKLVLDLNYTEDSPGLEYARSSGARYISGKAFFKAQARRQREFWSRAFENHDRKKGVTRAGAQIRSESPT